MSVSPSRSLAQLISVLSFSRQVWMKVGAPDEQLMSSAFEP